VAKPPAKGEREMGRGEMKQGDFEVSPNRAKSESRRKSESREPESAARQAV
jgi:hypothetical protein